MRVGANARPERNERARPRALRRPRRRDETGAGAKELVDPRREQLDRLVTNRSGDRDRVRELSLGESGLAARRDVVLDAGPAVAADGGTDRGELLVPLLELH